VTCDAAQRRLGVADLGDDLEAVVCVDDRSQAGTAVGVINRPTRW
jgi:hypothetical protein